MLIFYFSAKGKLMQGKMTTFMKKIVKIGKIARYPYKAKKRRFFGGKLLRYLEITGFLIVFSSRPCYDRGNVRRDFFAKKNR
ncbi:hypothetical protein EFR19_07235 [Lactobacillus delbrueckii subsp. bulgaricus]|nr:hypothetical protein [Lactobacillus delbrueckii subsp. bulgaricus]MCT3478620.1 hypothetical protein [Lactobacillus delbrueckii subsp. bulgaricus]MCT3480256.1 hypothetical protein [Lactobacillus delbrueckii subsp. bulgaricus]